MNTVNLDDLRRILTDVAGQDDNVDLAGDIADQPFEDLGYDSLALMEMAARIEQDYGIKIDDEQAAKMQTPQAFIELVNSELSRAS